MISSLIAASMLFGQAQPVATTTPIAPAPVAKVKEERKICKRESIATSLHGSKRVCLTAAQWRARELNATVEDLGAVTSK